MEVGVGGNQKIAVHRGEGCPAAFQNMALDAMRVELRAEEIAAKGIAERTGLGKLRHVEVKQLWVQEKVKNKVIEQDPDVMVGE